MADILLDANIEGYEILSLLGQGGMARVYCARQVSLNREVALKVLLPETRNDPDMALRFQREKSILKSLQHPHILPVYDFGQQGDMLWIAMQLVRGGTLQQMLGRQPMPLPDVVKIIEQIGSALSYAHRNGIVHRDLKPDNILVSEGPHLYLSDFGIAKLMEGTVLTTTGTSLGTPAYMSPEQLINSHVDARTDIYALGVLTYQMISGILPFDGQVFSVLQKHLNEPPPPLRDLLFDLPPQVERAVFKALEKKPDDRYTTAQEMVDAFRAAVEGRQREAAQILGQSGWDAPREEEAPAALAPLERSKKWPLAALLAGAAVAATGVFATMQKPPAPPAAPPSRVGEAVLAPVTQRLTYASKTTESDWQINLLDPGAPLRRLRQGGASRLWPDGKRLSFDDREDVYVMSLDKDEEPYLLTPSHKARDYWGSVAPDGSIALFHSDRSGHFLIWAQKLRDGRPFGNPGPLTRGALADQWASWSPDGKKIAFTRKQEGDRSAIFVKDWPAGLERQLSKPPRGSEDQYAAWSPDGREVVFQRNATLIRVNLEGREEPIPLPAGLSNPQNPVWAPSPVIAFVCSQGLFTWDVKNGRAEKIAERPMPGGRVAVSELGAAALGPLLRHFAAVASLLFLGTVLRAYDLTGQSFSFDETMDVGLARTTSWSEVWRFAAPWHIHPPFHLVVLKTWGTLFGWGEATLRSLSVLLSVAVGCVSWRLARELCSAPRVAVWTVGWWCVSPLSFFWARNTRSHALFALLVALAMLAAWRLVIQPTRRGQLAYAATAFLMIYTLHLGFAFLAVQGLWFLARRSRTGLVAWSVALLLYAPYAAHLLGHLQSKYLMYYQSTSLLDLWDAYEALLCYRFDHGAQPWVSLVFVPVVLLGLRRLPAESRSLVLSWLSLPALVWILSQARPGFRFWYFDACLPAVGIVLACGLKNLKARWLAPVAAVLAAVNLHADLDQVQRFRSQDWRGAIATIRRAAQPRDVVLMGNAYGYAYWAYEYYDGPMLWFDFNDKPSPSEVTEFFRKHRRVWILVVNDATLYFETLIEPDIPPSSRCVLHREYSSSNQGSFQLRLYERPATE